MNRRAPQHRETLFSQLKTASLTGMEFKRVLVKRLFLFFTGILLIPSASALPQIIWPPRWYTMKGDTLVIKDQDDLSGQANALYVVLSGDTVNVPPGRVYELKAGGVYPLQNNPNTYAYAGRKTVIVGSDSTPLVINKNPNSSPALICGFVGVPSNAGGINANGDLTIKNCALVPAADDSTIGWSFTIAQNSNLNLLYDNCLFEHTRDVFVKLANTNCNVTFRNCYFVNMSGQPCRRNGGVLDCSADQDTLLVENCTFVMAQGDMFRFWTHSFKRIIFNHNTFVNCAGTVFMNPGYQSKVSLTNNIFVNCNIQPYPGIHSIDVGEQDPDWQPMGLVNVYPDSVDVANKTPRKFFVDRNLAYWDPVWSNLIDTLNALHVDGVTTWQSNQITMNARTQSMFNDNTVYPYLTEGKWYTEKPLFVNPLDLQTTQLYALKKYVVAVADTHSAAVLADWRLLEIGPSNYVYYDWPIPVDLSYSNAGLEAGAINGFPIGDLNWFPYQKSAWLAQRAQEYNQIEDALNAVPIVAVNNGDAFPAEFTLHQNYPNPFNPSTTITFSFPHSAIASLKVYDMLGREAATLVNGYTTLGTHEIQFNATNLASGVYFYRLTSGNFNEMKKMMLVK